MVLRRRYLPARCQRSQEVFANDNHSAGVVADVSEQNLKHSRIGPSAERYSVRSVWPKNTSAERDLGAAISQPDAVRSHRVA